MFTLCALVSVGSAAFLGNLACEDLGRDLKSQDARWSQIMTSVLFLGCSGCVAVTGLYALVSLWVR